MSTEKEKELAAKAAIKYIEDGMTIGLGTGSTAAHMITALAEEVAKGLNIVGIPSSESTKKLALANGIPLTDFANISAIDINIDGTDEFDPYLQLIKGGGGALLREKILAFNSKLNIIIADCHKQVSRLGKFKLPIETIPFATPILIKKLRIMNLHPILREKDNSPFITDEGNYILDLDITHISNVAQLENTLKQLPGIVETGLFLDIADIVIIGRGDTTEVFKR
ncbi:ribose-5-phosphate isomerase [Arenibacter nanhaiticus]|uniref:Ribose-5-phosphate isomerase A n=1 Tax=Arenibacter nanhaiticus TaxID=558155 RepID=A0A1M6E6Z7_9FLAO|nr:ribose-5-phosphate isomerase RpiA [Arenibacter nanhaiticus]SHI81267.1 ribose-5-phosphate isomerase [Arenibacter nanhaiticus]